MSQYLQNLQKEKNIIDNQLKESKIKIDNLTKDQINNKKLVSLLKHKIFRGYIDIKNSKTFFRKKPKFVKTIDFEENNLEPFDDNYNLQYKRTYLSKLNSKINNPLQIKNESRFKISRTKSSL